MYKLILALALLFFLSATICSFKMDKSKMQVSNPVILGSPVIVLNQ